MSNALVLGGGGTLGISWEIGVLAGLLGGGVDVTAADLIVGTSAGSVVGTQIAQGQALQSLVEGQRTAPDGIGYMMDFDIANVVAAFTRWAGFPAMNVEACAEVGTIALASRTTSEDGWIDSFTASIGREWPTRGLLLTAVNAQSGEFRTWSRDDSIDIRRAVASSCAVPGMFPCVQFKGRRYTDGGVRSGTSADLATGHENVLIIAPIGAGASGIDLLVGRQARDEADALTSRGANDLVFPDAMRWRSWWHRMDGSKRISWSMKVCGRA
jgi:NTE family protein